MNQAIEKKPGGGPLLAGWICFGIGLLLMYFSLLLFLLYAPLFLAAFILAIVAMAQKRIGGGLGLLLCAMFVPLFMVVGMGADRIEEVNKRLGSNKAPTATPAAPTGPELEIIDFDCRLSSYAKVEGHLKNISSRRMDNLRVTASFYAQDGTSLGSNSSIVEFTALLPGQSTPFSVIGPRVESYKNCSFDGFTEGFMGKNLQYTWANK